MLADITMQIAVVVLLAVGYLVIQIYRSRRVANELRTYLYASLKLAGISDSELDPDKDQFLAGYIVKFSADFADRKLPSKRWGLVGVALRFVFGDKCPHIAIESYVNNFDSDEFIDGVNSAIADQVAKAGAYPHLLCLHYRAKSRREHVDGIYVRTF